MLSGNEVSVNFVYVFECDLSKVVDFGVWIIKLDVGEVILIGGYWW